MQNCDTDVYQHGLPDTAELEIETSTRELKLATINKSCGTSAQQWDPVHPPFGNTESGFVDIECATSPKWQFP